MMSGSPIGSQLVGCQAVIITPQARRYLGQLCKHFQHKCAVTLEDVAGSIRFDAGTCRLQPAGDTLTLALEASDQTDLHRLQDVVARHLLRFAFREDPSIDWIPA
jgi:uncharacterized protein